MHNGKQVKKINLVNNIKDNSGKYVQDCINQPAKEADPFAKHVCSSLAIPPIQPGHQISFKIER